MSYVEIPEQLEFNFPKHKFSDRFDNVWVMDFEYSNIGGSLVPSSVAIKNISSHLPPDDQETICTIFRDEEGRFIPPDNPFEDGWQFKKGKFCLDPKDLFIGFSWEAESQVFEELEWAHPMHIIDVQVEVKNNWNGYTNSFQSFSLKDVAEKLNIEHNYLPDDKGNLRKRLGEDTINWSSKAEREAVKRYNIEDVEVTAKLFKHWENAMCNIHGRDELYKQDYWSKALSRGLDADIVGQIDRKGYPIDVDAWEKTMKALPDIKAAVIHKAHIETYCFPGGNFSSANFKSLLEDKKLITYFPRTANGKLKIDQETLRSYEDIDGIKLIKEALYLKNATKLNDLPIDPRDNRAKTMFWMFSAKTGRAAPSTSKHILNMAGCFRPFIKATDKASIVTIDYEQQEFGIAAKLTEDPEMIKAYWTEDPYSTLGKQAGIIPKDAKGKDHPKRQAFKTVCLMTQYGAGVQSMARDMKASIEEAEMALQHHQRVFHKFWENQEKFTDKFLMDGHLALSDGYNLKIEPGSTFRQHGNTKGYTVNTLKNWPIQATGCQIMRRALQRLNERDLELPIGIMHDEFIFENMWTVRNEFHQYHIDEWEKELVEAANDIIGMPLKVETKVIPQGHRFPVKHDKDMELFKLFAEVAGFNV